MANKKDYATSTVLTAPSPADSGTELVVQSGHGARFPEPPFYITAQPQTEYPTIDNAEKILVTEVDGDTFTIVREQGETEAKSIAAGWRVANAVFEDDFQSRVYKTVGFSNADYIVDGVDDDVQIQAAIDELADGDGGVVFLKAGDYVSGTIILKQGVSIIGESRQSVGITLQDGANQWLVSEDFDTAAGSGNSYAGIHGFQLENFTLWGNAWEQDDSGESDYRDRNALIKIYGYQFTIRNIYLDYAREVALYTEHDYNWNSENFNEWAFGESIFENIYIKNHGKAGWVNRGSHDSHAKSVYISNYTDGGTFADYGLICQLSTTDNYGSQGMIADNVHIWGEYGLNALRLEGGANIIQGKVYAEGSTYAAISIDDASTKNNFEAVVGYAPYGVELDSGSTGNNIKLWIESNISGNAFVVKGSSAGNTLELIAGQSTGAIFALQSYTGGNNTFKTTHTWNATLFSGTPNANDRIDAVSDSSPDSSRVTQWELPVRSGKLKVSSPSNIPTVHMDGGTFRSTRASGDDRGFETWRTGEAHARSYLDGYGSLYFGGTGSAQAKFLLGRDGVNANHMNLQNVSGFPSLLSLRNNASIAGMNRNAEATYAGVIGDAGSDGTGSEFIDWFHNHYESNGDVQYGIMMQKTGATTAYRPFYMGYYDKADVADTEIIRDREAFMNIEPDLGVGTYQGATLTGTVSITSGSATVTGSSTLFTTELKVGDSIRIGSVSRRISAISSNTSLTTSANWTATSSGQTVKKYNRFRGRMGIRTHMPTAFVDIAGGIGGATAGSASLKVQPATALLTTPESGAIENNGSHLYYTDSSGVRRALDGSSPYVTVGSSNADYITDGTADNVQIQAAIDSLGTRGGIVFIKTGNYYLSSTITIAQHNISVIGEGVNSTVLHLGNSMNANAFTIQHASTRINYIELSHFAINGNKANNTSGRGIELYGGWRYNLHDLYIYDTKSRAISLSGATPSTTGLVGKISNVYILRSDSVGMYVEHQHDAVFENIYIDTTGAEGILETNSTSNVYIRCHAYNATEYGIRLTSSNMRTSLIHCLGETCDKAGIRVTGTYVNLTNCSAFNNSQGTANTYSGIEVTGSYNNVSNSRCYDSQGGSATQKYGIEESGSANNNMFTNNDCTSGNVTGTITTVGANTVVYGFGDAVPLKAGGTGTSLSDPGADRILAWDDSAGVIKFIPVADITNEDIPQPGDYALIYGAEGDLRKTDWNNVSRKAGRSFYAYEDFVNRINTPNFLYTGSGTSGTSSVPDASSIGVATFNTGSGSTNRYGIWSNGVTVLYFSTSALWQYETKMKAPTLSDGTETYQFFTGFGDSATAEPTDGVYFHYTHSANSGNITCVSRSNGTDTGTRTDSGVALAADTWYKLRVVVGDVGGTLTARFYINGSLVATHTTNIPSSAARSTGYGAHIIKSAGSTNRYIALDYIEVIGDFPSGR